MTRRLSDETGGIHFSCLTPSLRSSVRYAYRSVPLTSLITSSRPTLSVPSLRRSLVTSLTPSVPSGGPEERGAEGSECKERTEEPTRRRERREERRVRVTREGTEWSE